MKMPSERQNVRSDGILGGRVIAPMPSNILDQRRAFVYQSAVHLDGGRAQADFLCRVPAFHNAAYADNRQCAVYVFRQFFSTRLLFRARENRSNRPARLRADGCRGLICRWWCW